ncbi:chorion class B protein PC10-like [Nymphalis io]|uniref:chorion class B protein PC10-like n=1 Tax=Inachis io TaxID=171585 RepID=UPI002169A02E|nr:chorion class B protein PC10-like [Nymphalis io]
MYKAVLLVCAQALMIQSIATQCIGAGFAGAPWAAGAPCAAAAPLAVTAGPCGAYGPAAFAASNGGGFGVSSASPIAATGVSVLSENAIEGALAVNGVLPFLGTVALEGVLPTAGAGAVSYGCGNGEVAIVAEDIAPIGIAGPLGYAADAYGYGPLGYGVGPLAGPYSRAGCGCGALL